MTMHHVGIELARDRLRKSAFTRSSSMPRCSSPAAAVDAGFLDTLVSADQLQEARVQRQQLKKLNMTAHRNTKLKVRKALLETLNQAIGAGQKTPGLRPAPASPVGTGLFAPNSYLLRKVTLPNFYFYKIITDYPGDIPGKPGHHETQRLRRILLGMATTLAVQTSFADRSSLMGKPHG